MEESPIDLAAVIEQLQHENEELRLRLVKVYAFYSKIDVDHALQFVKNHYQLFLVAAAYIIVALSLYETIRVRRHER